ncbi:hypothetical protein OSB04_000896 [Centaurea solstitialis]|uniref:dCTP pyrophosphatase 1 n=1 Tax=Centaurea solstitialis TaxID=347529 RepID=A0AA38TQ07_9ASTR|nr:hypothetical protein OSB04_000896 [Centaurea solstitialis]
MTEGDDETVTLKLLKQKMHEFAQERDWERHHSPRNLLLALVMEAIDSERKRRSMLQLDGVDPSREDLYGVGEVGELSEIFQWKGEVEKGLADWKEEEKVHLGEELSDVLLYLVRLSDICGVDLGQAALRKIRLNAIKYPIPNPNPTSNSNP